MDHSQFLQILATCTALPEEKREEIAEATKELDAASLKEFANQFLALHAKLGAVSKQESALLTEIEKVVNEGAKALAKDDRKRKEAKVASEEGEYLGTLLDQ